MPAAFLAFLLRGQTHAKSIEFTKELTVAARKPCSPAHVLGVDLGCASRALSCPLETSPHKCRSPRDHGRSGATKTIPRSVAMSTVMPLPPVQGSASGSCPERDSMSIAQAHLEPDVQSEKNPGSTVMGGYETLEAHHEFHTHAVVQMIHKNTLAPSTPETVTRPTSRLAPTSLGLTLMGRHIEWRASQNNSRSASMNTMSVRTPSTRPDTMHLCEP